MRTQLGLTLLAVGLTNTVGFLPSIATKGKVVAATRRAQPLFVLGGGDFDLLKGSKPTGPAKDEYDLLGSKAQADVPVLNEVRSKSIEPFFPITSHPI